MASQIKIGWPNCSANEILEIFVVPAVRRTSSSPSNGVLGPAELTACLANLVDKIR
jgi:hypothetical protein